MQKMISENKGILIIEKESSDSEKEIKNVIINDIMEKLRMMFALNSNLLKKFVEQTKVINNKVF